MSVENDLEFDDKISLRLPKQYKVILLNDDYTSMEFVVMVLMNIFHKNTHEAKTLMLLIHKAGRAVCGIYSYEIAETKVSQVHQFAREEGFPLKAILEEL